MAPYQAADPDLYLRSWRRGRRIIVNGAKAHNSCSAYADEIVVLPTRNMASDETDWAVAFPCQQIQKA